MYISRRQSQILAVGTLLLFFTVGILFANFQSSSTGSISSYPTESTQVADSSEKTLPQTDEVQANEVKAPQQVASQQIVSEEAKGALDPSRFSLEEFHRSETRNGKTLWEVTGKNAQYFPETNSVKIHNCELLFYSKDSKAVKLTSGEAMVHLSGPSISRADLSSNVQLLYDGKTTITTESAVFNQEEEIITAEGPVKIEGSWYTITGVGMKADMEKQKFKLLNTVETHLDPRRRQ